MTEPVNTRLLPRSPEAERSVVGQLLARPKLIADVVGAGLEAGHFHTPALKTLFDEIIVAYYADEPTDALSIAEACQMKLAQAWRTEPEKVVAGVRKLADTAYEGRAVDHAKLVKRDSDYRSLLVLCSEVSGRIFEEEGSPEELAGELGETAMRIATSTLLTQDIFSFDELGPRFTAALKKMMAAREQGVEIGVYFGLPFIDQFTRGLKPSEFWILGGEPGAGKSGLAWLASLSFAERQMKRPKDKRVGTFVLSLEMAEEPSTGRIAQAVTDVDGGRLREGRTTDDDLRTIAREWQVRAGIPLYFNFTSTLRASQLRALVVNAIQRYNIGLLVIDHLRYFDMDGHFNNPNEEEEAKSRFLKQDIATQLDCAVLCLAHTTKAIETTEDRRPRLSHLRGSGQIAAHADFVSFMYQPYMHAKAQQIEEGKVKRTDAELIWAKNRHALGGIAPFQFDISSMTAH